MSSQQSPSIAKACVVPVCGNNKFSLVHKFPADRERFAEWLESIQKCKIEKLYGLTPDVIRKRYFVCSRHFSPKEYKNSESRSLNLTAVPHLNITNLDGIHLSKAGQEDHQANVKQEIITVQPMTPSAKSPQPIRILNSSAGKATSASELSPKVVLTQLTPPMPKQATTSSLTPVKTAKRKISDESLNDTPKHSRLQSPPAQNQANAEPSTPPTSSNCTPQIPAILKTPPNDTTPKASNKLLALMEVTPEQYEKLSKSLLSTSNANLLINLLGGDENDPSSADNEIVLKFDDDSDLPLDLFWLRDHCRCRQCYDESNHQRKLNILDIPDDVKCKKYELKDGNVHVTWNDNHVSKYELNFLIQNQPNKINQTKEICLWNNESIEAPIKKCLRVSFLNYMSNPESSKKVLESLHVYGVAFIDGVQPPSQQNTEFVIRNLFPIHKTFFGEMWTFSDAKKDHSDTAYTNIYLGPHNDNTYFNDASGLQILHCIARSGNGGENFLIDGFQVAEKIKQEHPEVFKRLTTTIVTGEYIEEGRHHKYSAPIINLDPVTGSVSQIRFNLNDRAPVKTVEAGKIRQFYSDLKVLSREFESIENRVSFTLEPGTVMIFDNWRVLHGRTAYTGSRTMTGCYVARTEFQSALRGKGFIE